MKAKEIREKDDEALGHELIEKQKHLFDLRTQAVTEKLMMYALNRQLEYFDMPQVRGVVRRAAKDNYKFSSIVLGIVNTDAFRKQGPLAR